MSTPFQAALLAFIAAEKNFEEAAEACRAPGNARGAITAHDVMERALAQAGDVLEREVRQMIREERERA